MERKKGICANFLFVLFDALGSYPTEAAKETVSTIKQAIEYLYPKEYNHKEMRNEWSIVFVTTLIYHLEDYLEELKHANRRTNGRSKRKLK